MSTKEIVMCKVKADIMGLRNYARTNIGEEYAESLRNYGQPDTMIQVEECFLIVNVLLPVLGREFVEKKGIDPSRLVVDIDRSNRVLAFMSPDLDEREWLAISLEQFGLDMGLVEILIRQASNMEVIRPSTSIISDEIIATATNWM